MTVVPGGADGLAAAVDSQVERRRRLAVPSIDDDPRWVLVFEEGGVGRRVRETLCTVADGVVGTRGSAEEEPRGSDPLVVAAGVYADHPPALLAAPRWTRLDLAPAARPDRWKLDLRGGLLARVAGTDTLLTLRFSSKARPGCVVLRADLPAGSAPGSPLTADRSGAPPRHAAVSSRRGGIAAAGADRVVTDSDRSRLERIVAYVARTGRPPAPEEATAALGTVRGLGSDILLAEHRRRWAGLWNDGAVDIDGDPDCELAVRFALYHLFSAAAEEGEATVGARGLTGLAYQGHVFWDADVFVLPALCAVAPSAARAMLEYRIRRLPAARWWAARSGNRGARFPWESADDGRDVTPRAWTDPEGNRVPIHTGDREEHITADVAWAARHYSRWCGDAALLEGRGRDLVLDTARYWASRARETADGKHHLFGVIGPDEYHEVVDDNAYTNVMARANLRWAVELAEQLGAAAAERTLWSRIAGSLVDGFDPATRRYEQFTGYYSLEPTLIEQIATPPIAADLVMGRRRVAASQIVKQPDVLMLHHLVPEMVAAGSLVPNLDFYLARTAHGSSLSPAICASLLARAGRPEEALRWFRLASRLDLDDLTGTTAGGIHLATMGGLWQALAFGFLGISVQDGVLRLAPVLPRAWSQVTQRLCVLGRRVVVHAARDELTVEADGPLPLACGRAPAAEREHAGFARRPTGWEEVV